LNTRSRSITRELILRMCLAGLVLALTVGAGTYFLERQRIAAAIEERATLGVELLRTSVFRRATDPDHPGRRAASGSSIWSIQGLTGVA